MNITESISTLQNHESFAHFVQMIHDLREETIQELHDAPVDKLQQVSGRLITYDQVLHLAGWENLQKRHLNRK